MKQKIKQLISNLRNNAEQATRLSKEMTRDTSLKGQDIMLAKMSNALANDLQKIVDEEGPEEFEDNTLKEDVTISLPKGETKEGAIEFLKEQIEYLEK